MGQMWVTQGKADLKPALIKLSQNHYFQNIFPKCWKTLLQQPKKDVIRFERRGAAIQWYCVKQSSEPSLIQNASPHPSMEPR